MISDLTDLTLRKKERKKSELSLVSRVALYPSLHFISIPLVFLRHDCTVCVLHNCSPSTLPACGAPQGEWLLAFFPFSFIRRREDTGHEIYAENYLPQQE